MLIKNEKGEARVRNRIFLAILGVTNYFDTLGQGSCHLMDILTIITQKIIFILKVHPIELIARKEHICKIRYLLDLGFYILSNFTSFRCPIDQYYSQIWLTISGVTNHVDARMIIARSTANDQSNPL